MALKQHNRSLHLSTSLGEDALLLASFSGSEEISRLFRYQLELISDDPGIMPQDVVGTPIGWNIELAAGSRRHWNGYVSQLARGDVDREGRRSYRVEVVPWLWFLTQTSDCKIFQEKTVPEILDKVLADFGFADYRTDFRLDHKRWEYCVQYRETDFNFLSRLMEQEGIFYYFAHSDGVHQLVITDHQDAYAELPESKVDFPIDSGSVAVTDHITSWERRFRYVSGKYAQRDFNFMTPGTDLKTESKTVVDLPDIANYEIYDYPGEYPDKETGGGETKLRIEAEESRHDVVNGTSQCKTFQVGGVFQVGEHHDQAEAGAKVVVTSIHHAAAESMAYETGGSSGFDYRNTFACIPADRVFRPARTSPKPIISGIQTAIVTGPEGEEIYPDEFGRVKCQFHWDRYGGMDDNSSCWIRVAQVHAGAGFGGVSLPRIGEEVVISFLEGDPDRPLITGRVYHAQNMPPWELPANKTQSGIKTRSTKEGGPDNANEIRFEDKKGDEQLLIHAEKDQLIEVENDETHWVGHDRTKLIDHDESSTIGNDRSERVGHDESIQIDNDRKEVVSGNENIRIGKNRAERVEQDEQVVVGGKRDQQIGKDDKLQIGGGQVVSIAQDAGLDVDGGRSVSVGKTDSLSVGQDLLIDAGDQIVLKVGKASITMKKNGDILINGKNLVLDGSGKIDVKASKDLKLKGSKIAQN